VSPRHGNSFFWGPSPLSILPGDRTLNDPSSYPRPFLPLPPFIRGPTTSMSSIKDPFLESLDNASSSSTFLVCGLEQAFMSYTLKNDMPSIKDECSLWNSIFSLRSESLSDLFVFRDSSGLFLSPPRFFLLFPTLHLHSHLERPDCLSHPTLFLSRVALPVDRSHRE